VLSKDSNNNIRRHGRIKNWVKSWKNYKVKRKVWKTCNVKRRSKEKNRSSAPAKATTTTLQRRLRGAYKSICVSLVIFLSLSIFHSSLSLSETETLTHLCFVFCLLFFLVLFIYYLFVLLFIATPQTKQPKVAV